MEGLHARSHETDLGDGVRLSACVYPKAKPAHLGEGATSFLKERLSDRGVSTANSRRDDFTSGEFQYDLDLGWSTDKNIWRSIACQN